MIGACGSDGTIDAGAATTSETAPPTTAGPATTAVSTDSTTIPPTEAWDLGGLEIRLDQPVLWRVVGSPPDGADAAVYAPSDNNAVAERLLVKAVPLDRTGSLVAQVEEATNDLEANYDVVLVLDATQTVVGVDRVSAQQVRFTWEKGEEAGIGRRWVIPAETQLIYITLLADLSEPSLYLRDVQDVLLAAVIGG